MFNKLNDFTDKPGVMQTILGLFGLVLGVLGAKFTARDHRRNIKNAFQSQIDKLKGGE